MKKINEIAPLFAFARNMSNLGINKSNKISDPFDALKHAEEYGHEKRLQKIAAKDPSAAFQYAKRIKGADKKFLRKVVNKSGNEDLIERFKKEIDEKDLQREIRRIVGLLF